MRSAYQMLQTIKGNYPTDANFGFWRRFWQLKVPSKAKDLMWRALSKCLPTRYSLRLKHVDVDVSCSVCGIYAETDVHCLISCQLAWECWVTADLSSNGRNFDSISDWFEEVMQGADDKCLGRVVMICWAVWKARNELVWQQRRRRAEDVVVYVHINPFLKIYSDIVPLDMSQMIELVQKDWRKG